MVKPDTKKMRIYDQPQSLLAKTRELLIQSGKTDAEICGETGIPPYWLYSLRGGQVQGHNVNRTQYLYEHLTGKALAV